MVPTKKKKPDHSLVVTWIGSKTPRNRTEVIGLTKWMQTISPSCPKQAALAQAFARFVHRAGLATSYADYYEAFFKPFCDTTVNSAWKRATSAKVKAKPTAAQFCKDNLSLVVSAMPEEPLKKVLGCNGDYGTVLSELNTVIGSGDAGMAMWPFALLTVLGKKVDGIIEEEAVKWGKAGPLTQESLQQQKTDIIAKVADIENNELLPASRAVEFTVAGTKFTFDVESLAHHVSLQLSFAWRPIATNANLLEKLFCYDAVLPNPRPISDVRVSECLYGGPNAARKGANKAFRESGDLTGEQTRNTMKKIKASFVVSDPDFDADALLIMSVGGDNGYVRLVVAMEKLFPTAGGQKNVETVLHEIAAMVNDNIYKLASKAAQVMHDAVKKVLCSLVDAKCPELGSLEAEPKVKGLVDKFDYFVRFTESSGQGSKGRVLTGLAAMKAKLQRVTEKKAQGPVTKADVEELETYMFLVPDSDKANFLAIIKEANDSQSAHLQKAAKAKKGASSKKDKAVSEAMAMFT
ncbi:unnamed protein product [Prorocentrum cordatum]|uniref:FACT complex subunit n=1 Tax=Prorocentrum cordatum TaxID=2364126 RepID=A0ABN9VTE2_9DINO|nr:unnamed protein product [Polarella glacialis]